MKIRRTLRVLALLFCFGVTVSVIAQETEEGAAPVAPDLYSLQSDSWSYFDGPRNEVEPRTGTFLEEVGTQIADLSAQNQEAAQSLLDAVEDNLRAYLTLLDEADFERPELAPEAANYSIEELLALSETARDARSGANDQQLEVAREQRVLDGAQRLRDTAFKDYVNAAAGDERWLAALRLLRARTTQAISERRLELLTQSYEGAAEFAQATAARVDLARERLASAADDSVLEQLRELVSENEAIVANRVEEEQAAKIAASALDLDTPQARSEQRLAQQKLLGAEIALALAEVTLAQTQAELRWTELKLDAESGLDDFDKQSLTWTERLRMIEQRTPEWQRDIEDELLAVQSVGRNDLDRASRRLLDQRLGTAQASLAEIGELDAAVADLTLLMQVVDDTVAESTGALRSWLASVSRSAKGAFSRVASLGDFTLFHIGETPVTGGDILRVIIILTFAFFLSRGIRHAIRRVADTEYSGTQASLYTVGRLTHYAIIIIALFIALSSIGLDFGNLALVAGALSVGIGFGLQSIVNNFVSGLVILFEHTLRVGDYIELDTGLTGTVKAINVRSTLINTNDNIDIVVPNSEFVTTRLTNWTLGERNLRVRIPFGVAYGSDKDLVRQAAIEATEEVPYTLTNMKGREPDIWLVEYGDNSLNFLLLVWVNRQGARRPTRTKAAYLWALETKLREYGVEIPFPQRDLHLRSGWQNVPANKER